MKRIFSLLVSAVLLAGSFAFAEEAMLIDFTRLQKNCVKEEGSDQDTQNNRTVMDFSVAAGATFDEDSRKAMRASLALSEWEVELNSSARSVGSLATSKVVSAKVKDSAKVSFKGSEIMGVRVVFPTIACNSSAKILPPFDIPAYEPYYGDADADGNLPDPEKDENGNPKKATPPENSDEGDGARTIYHNESGTRFEGGYGVVKNVGTIKSIAVKTMGMNHPHGLYVMLKDTDGIERRYFMGYLGFDGWKTLIWQNPQYLTEIRQREIRVYPIYPRGLPFVKFTGFQITRDAAQNGGDFIGYFKDVRVIYDRALLTSDRDIDDEGLWGIITGNETARQNAELQRFGNVQVNRYLEKQKMAKSEEAFQSFGADEGGDTTSAAQSNQGQAAN